MALAIATNNAALQAAASASSVNRAMETSMARLSSGLRINSANDDAAGVAIASRLSSEIRGTDQAIRNAMDGRALIDTAEGAHKEVENILQRMREVAVQAANDTNDSSDRLNLQAEMDALTVEIDRIAAVTTWAGQSMMNADNTQFSFQVGTATGTKNQISIAIDAMDTSSTGLALTKTSTIADVAFTANTEVDSTSNFKATAADKTSTVTIEGVAFTANSPEGTMTVANIHIALATAINASAEMKSRGISAVASATKVTMTYNGTTETPGAGAGSDVTVHSAGAARLAVANIDSAIKAVNTQRSELGAVSNRLSHTVNNLTNISANLSAAKGGIEDADFAVETTELAKNQILQQASTAMLAQANAAKQNVLSLLQG